MAENPLILALANPVPEIMPDLVKSVRPDAIVATGRSDYPNQVNNVLCFPICSGCSGRRGKNNQRRDEDGRCACTGRYDHEAGI